MDSDIYMDLMTRDVRFGPKKGQIGTKWDKSGTFEDNFSVHFGSVELCRAKIH